MEPTLDLYRHIGWKLMNLRQSLGLTQSELGQQIGLSKYQISRVERGLGDTTLENLHLLCRHFKITIAELFTKDEIPKVEVKIRSEYFEKKDIETVRYGKVLPSSPKIKLLRLNPKSLRKIKNEENEMKDLVVLKGTISVETLNDMKALCESKIASIHRKGEVYIKNFADKKAVVLLIQTVLH